MHAKSDKAVVFFLINSELNCSLSGNRYMKNVKYSKVSILLQPLRQEVLLSYLLTTWNTQMKKSSILVCFADSRSCQYAVRKLASSEDTQHEKKLTERKAVWWHARAALQQQGWICTGFSLNTDILRRPS